MTEGVRRVRRLQRLRQTTAWYISWPFSLQVERHGEFGVTSQFVIQDQAARGPPCLLMEWSGRAPARPAIEAGKGRQRQGARHVTEDRHFNCRDRHRYRQELI